MDLPVAGGQLDMEAGLLYDGCTPATRHVYDDIHRHRRRIVEYSKMSSAPIKVNAIGQSWIESMTVIVVTECDAD